MTVAQIIADRGIEEVLHFTTNRGLVGILASGAVKSRDRLPKDKYLAHVYSPNCETRKDVDWLDYVNLSITRVNTRLLSISSGRWHVGEDVWWCILAFDPLILTHDDVHFATTNNFYSGVSRAAGPRGLEALFGPRIVQFFSGGKASQVVTRVAAMQPDQPTCEQAEVLYPGELSCEYLRRIYVQEEAHADVVAGQCALFSRSDVAVVIKRGAFN